MQMNFSNANFWLFKCSAGTRRVVCAISGKCAEAARHTHIWASLKRSPVAETFKNHLHHPPPNNPPHPSPLFLESNQSPSTSSWGNQLYNPSPTGGTLNIFVFKLKLNCLKKNWIKLNAPLAPTPPCDCWRMTGSQWKFRVHCCRPSVFEKFWTQKKNSLSYSNEHVTMNNRTTCRPTSLKPVVNFMNFFSNDSIGLNRGGSWGLVYDKDPVHGRRVLKVKYGI